MSGKGGGRDLPLASLALVALLLWAAFNVVHNPEWHLWIESHCGWLCQ